MRTQRSRVKLVGTISYVYSTVPSAGIGTGRGIRRTRSGWAMFQPVVHWVGGGASFGSPPGDFASTHLASVAICSAVSEGSSKNFPQHESANHGGMVLV